MSNLASEAWDLAPNKERSADTTTTFIIFTEDGMCEPSYFSTFQKSGKVKVSVAGDQKSGFRNYANTLQWCEQRGLLEKDGLGGYAIKADVTHHIWSVYDRDVDISRPEMKANDDLTFTQSIRAFQNVGINVAWSNDAFELWILLHFEIVPPEIAISRDEIYTRLTEIFKTLPGQSPEMSKETSKEKFSYKLSFKKRNEFNLFVLPHLEPRREQAEQRAQVLVAAFPTGHLFHNCNPLTKVPLLVNSIRSFH